MSVIALTTQDEMERRRQVFNEYIRSEDYQEKLITRLQVQDACNKSAKAQAMTWNLCARPDNPAEGCIFFVENFLTTFDPRPHAVRKVTDKKGNMVYEPMHNLPFILFDYQKDAIRAIVSHIDEGLDMLFEKSRDMGASWVLFVAVPLWYWLFRDGSNVLVGSYKESLVDNGNKDSIFGMLGYALEKMPSWLMPKGFNINKHKTKLKLINPVNNNQITGDTMNPNFGRGTRKTVVLFDELGFWDYAKDAWESTGDVTSCRIANSTPAGYNYYESLRSSGMDVYTMHWKQHPLKNEAWYAYEVARRTPEEVAQELDISYSKSLEGRVYPEWNDTNVVKGDFKFNPTAPLYVGWDYGVTDDTAIIWVQPNDRGGWNVIDSYRNVGKTIAWYMPFITGIVPSDPDYPYTQEELDMIEEHKEWGLGTHFGDPAGRFTNPITNTSVFDEMNKYGVRVNFRDDWKSFPVRKSAGRRAILEGIQFNDTKRNDFLYRSMIQAAYPKVRRGGVDETNSKAPLHNWTSHFRSSWEYLALGLESFTHRHDRPYDKIKPQTSKFGRKRGITGY